MAFWGKKMSMGFVNTQASYQIIFLPFAFWSNLSKFLSFFEFHFPICQIEKNSGCEDSLSQPKYNAYLQTSNFSQFTLFSWLPSLNRDDSRPLESDFLRAIALKSECLHLNPRFKASWPMILCLSPRTVQGLKEKMQWLRSLV